METSLPLHAVKPEERNFTMDVMRGIAVLGILLMNIPEFSIDEFYLRWNDALAGKLTLNGFIYKSATLLFQGRMRGLFTLLFGAGIMLFIQNKRSNSIQVADAYFRRMTWLLVFGMIDAYVLLWTGDILFEYALCGIFIYVLRRARVRHMVLIAITSIGMNTFIETREFSDFKPNATQYLQAEKLIKQGKTLDKEQKKVHDDFKFLLGHFLPFSDTVIKETSKDIVKGIQLHRSDYLEMSEKLGEETYKYQSTVFYSIFGETFGTILLGMALFKLGFFTGRLKPKVYWLMCLLGISFGLGLIALFMKLIPHTQAELWEAYRWPFDFSIDYLMEAGRVFSTLGYAALIYLLTQAKSLQKFLSLFANVGRMALTNYIMQTIFCSLFFFGFGFGHYGEYRAKGLLLVVVCIWIIQLTYSSIYLRYFQMGPLEWLWKRLTYGKAVSKS